jgi:formylglycine-generating enzyme required for sulfatase activity
MGSNPSSFQNGTALGTSGTISETNYLLRPVEKVSWYDAVVFCNKLSLQMGKTRCYKLKDGTSYPDEAQNISQSNDDNWDNMICDWTANGYRLPTECEWECAARGGTYSTTTPWTYKYSGAGDDDIDKVAWYTSNSSSHTWEVGLKDPNTLGLHDMSGNVWEWCWDNYNESIDSSTPATGPTPSDLSDFRRRRRGGSWDGKASFCAVAYRGNFDPYNRYANNGFRLACSGAAE